MMICRKKITRMQIDDGEYSRLDQITDITSILAPGATLNMRERENPVPNAVPNPHALFRSSINQGRKLKAPCKALITQYWPACASGQYRRQRTIRIP